MAKRLRSITQVGIPAGMSFDYVQKFVTNPDSYLLCRVKAYPMWARIVPYNEDIRVVNRFVRLDSDVDTYTTLCKSTPILVRGAMGKYENLAISYECLYRDFTAGRGEPITPQLLLQRMNEFNKQTGIKVLYRPKSMGYCAVFVPSEYSCEIQIKRRTLLLNVDTRPNTIIHGDFIVCPFYDMHIDFSSAFVVCGDLFSAVFDSRFWRACID